MRNEKIKHKMNKKCGEKLSRGEDLKIQSNNWKKISKKNDLIKWK